MIKTQDIKNSLRIDHSLDDALIGTLIGTAKGYIISTIGIKAKEGIIEGYKQFDWSVSLLVQHWYLKHQEASSERIPITVQALIQQM